ncbi:MAG: hypothetical protein LCH98_05295 [Actinobacteria bacterium]|nr:hypothetical protein [Actinomycetota bacterium]
MRAAIALGGRLAWGSGWRGDGARRRSVLLALASAVATAALLLVEQFAGHTFAPLPLYGPGFVDAAGPVLLVICAVVPVLVLVAVAGRMAAEARERRLAALRLLGLSAGRSSLVAATELTVATAIGVLVGLWAAGQVPNVPNSIGAFSWPPGDTSSIPRAGNQLVIAAVVLAVAVLPTVVRPRPRAAIAPSVRRGGAPSSSRRRALPLAAGLGLCLLARLRYDVGGGARSTEAVLLFAAGTALTAVGIVVVVPLLVRLVADALVRWGARSPAALIAGRRMQAQPAAAARVVATLVVALFLGTAAQATVAAQESLSDRWLPPDASAMQILYIQRPDALAAVDRDPSILAEAPGVVQVARYGTLSACDPQGRDCRPVLVATCAALTSLMPSVSGCVDGTPYRLVVPGRAEPPLEQQIVLRRPWLTGDEPAPPDDPAVPYSTPSAELLIPGASGERIDPLVLPPDTPQLATLRGVQDDTIRILAQVGRALPEYLSARGVAVVGQYVPETDPRRIAELRDLTLALTLFGLIVGLVAFAITLSDRLGERRAEVVGLQLVGTPRALLQASHAWETGTPLVLGAGLALALGRALGDVYLGIGWQGAQAPVVPGHTTLVLVGAALVGVIALTTLTARLSNPRIRPDLIRAT